jgi:alkylation response protein AidB-like acyl-CoA dehydrogenase
LRSNIILEEFSRAEAPGELSSQGAAMLVPTLLEKGSDAQKAEYIPPTLCGELVWCQGYSEQGAGSDLASIQTRGELDGDEWVINGHKIWTSGAHESDMMFCLVRTEPDAGKHAGISYLLIDMKSPGIRVGTLMQMTRSEEFCEVFFDDVRAQDVRRLTRASVLRGNRAVQIASLRGALAEERLPFWLRAGRVCAAQGPVIAQEFQHFPAKALVHLGCSRLPAARGLSGDSAARFRSMVRPPTRDERGARARDRRRIQQEATAD